MPASDFSGTNIRVEIDTALASSPRFERQGYTTVRHIPGSSEDVIQVMGLGTGVVTHRLLLSAAEWTALSAKLLTTGTLTLAGASQGDCLLEALSAPVRHVDGWVTVQAQFRQTGA